MLWLFVVIGALIGTTLEELFGFIVGSLLGALIFLYVEAKQQLHQLDKRLVALERNQQKDVVETKANIKTNIKPVEAPVKSVPISNPSPSIAVKQNKNDTPVKSTPNKILLLIKDYFSKGNIIVRVGIVVLFFGISFLVKYSIEHSLISIELRLTGVLIGALVMLFIGWRLRHKNKKYALLIQGTGIAILYLVVFSSFKLYHIVPSNIAFVFLVLISFCTLYLAAIQNAKSLAITAILGGFASPILVSTGHGSHVDLFSYYLILNGAIFALAWFKSWRLLNVIGFVFTFLVATVWGVMQYQPEHFNTTEPFLIAFFLIYVAISLLFATKQKPELKGYVDATLVFGVPMVGFGLQASLVHEMEYGLAWSAFALGIFYISIAKKLWSSSNIDFSTLKEAILALGVIFLTLVIPFALDGRWTASSWAIEGAGFVWIGLKQKRQFVLLFGILVQFIGGGLFLLDYPYPQLSNMIFFNTAFLGMAIVAISGLFSTYFLSHSDMVNKKEFPIHIMFLMWSMLWWYVGGAIQFDQYVDKSMWLTMPILFFIFTAWVLSYISLLKKWQFNNFSPWLLLLPLTGFFLASVINGQFFDNFGYLIWPIAFTVMYRMLFNSEQQKFFLFQVNALHGITYLLMFLIAVLQLRYFLIDQELEHIWVLSSSALVYVVALLTINRFKHWPIDHYSLSYQKYVAGFIMLLMAVWIVQVNFFNLYTLTWLAYIPLLNLIDLLTLLILFSVYDWYKQDGKSILLKLDKKVLIIGMGGFVFVWFNTLMFKLMNKLQGIPYDLSSLYHSDIIQMMISITWTLLGLAIMIVASKKCYRTLWVVGASLTGLVVTKLFLIDLAERDTIERIASFMIVGILLLIVGYFSPVPPVKDLSEQLE